MSLITGTLSRRVKITVEFHNVVIYLLCVDGLLVRFRVILTRFYPAVVLFIHRLLLYFVNCGFGIKWRRPGLLLIWLHICRGHLCCLSLLAEATFSCYLVGRIPGKCCLSSSTTFNSFVSPKPRINRG